MKIKPGTVIALLLLAAMALLAAACQPQNPPSPPVNQVRPAPALQGAVYIYCPPHEGAADEDKIEVDVRAGGRLVATLSRGRYFRYTAMPGRVQFRVRILATGLAVAAVDVKAGGLYFLEVGDVYKYGNIMAYAKEVDPAHGEAMVNRCLP